MHKEKRVRFHCRMVTCVGLTSGRLCWVKILRCHSIGNRKTKKKLYVPETVSWTKVVIHSSFPMSRNNWCRSNKSWKDQFKSSLNSSSERYIMKLNTSAKMVMTIVEELRCDTRSYQVQSYENKSFASTQ